MQSLLGEYFNVSIIDKEGMSTSRTWFFIVPSSRNPIKARYRFIHIESRSNKKGIYPYGSEENFDNWLNKNVLDMHSKYGQNVAESYRREMLPFKEKIRKIRQNIGLPMATLVTLEDELRKEQYAIFLKYDKEYQQQLLRLTNNQNEAMKLANKSFWEEIKKIRKMRLSDKNSPQKASNFTGLKIGLFAGFAFVLVKIIR